MEFFYKNYSIFRLNLLFKLTKGRTRIIIKKRKERFNDEILVIKMLGWI
jgi:hypothetical protein